MPSPPYHCIQAREKRNVGGAPTSVAFVLSPVVVTPEIPAPAVVAHPESATGGTTDDAAAGAGEPPSAPRVSTGSPANVTEPEECPYCAQALPSDRAVRYCPHCGINLRIRRCPGCSAEMEAEWKCCVTCGRSAA